MAKTNEKYRKFTTSSGKLVLAGKNAEQNEKVVNESGKNEYLLHTEAPGSPFCNIKSDFKDVSKEDLNETAIFCAKYSQAWKKSRVKKDVVVHFFSGKDIFKSKDMKLGTFGVKKVKKVIALANDIKKIDDKKE